MRRLLGLLGLLGAAAGALAFWRRRSGGDEPFGGWDDREGSTSPADPGSLRASEFEGGAAAESEESLSPEESHPELRTDEGRHPPSAPAVDTPGAQPASFPGDEVDPAQREQESRESAETKFDQALEGEREQQRDAAERLETDPLVESAGDEEGR